MTDLTLPGPFWLIGCGNMAGAMLRGWLAAGVDPAHFTVIRPSGAPVAAGVRVLTELPIHERPIVAMIGVKPQKLDEVAPGLAPAVEASALLISILAGVEYASLRDRFPGPRTIVRAMPNTPVALGKGATSLFAGGGTEEHRALAERLMVALGHVEWIADERLFDVVAALTASGPGFVFRFIDALATAAADLGMPSEQAQRLALATVEGAGALATSSGESTRQLAKRVASPGGMTRSGLEVLDSEDRFNRLVHATLEAAVRRSREIGEAARHG